MAQPIVSNFEQIFPGIFHKIALRLCTSSNTFVYYGEQCAFLEREMPIRLKSSGVRTAGRFRSAVAQTSNEVIHMNGTALRIVKEKPVRLPNRKDKRSARSPAVAFDGPLLMTPGGTGKKQRAFDPKTFLATIGDGRKMLTFEKGETVYTQGDPADAVFYVQKGKVRLTVVSKAGKEATIAILNEASFFGEGALAGQLMRMGSAAAMSDCEILRVEKESMISALHREHSFSDVFVAYLLARNIRYEEDLVDQLFNSSEKRLARVLLLLAHFGKEGIPEAVVPKISQETLAEMIGTTRSRVSFFMNRFRKLGFINYSGGLDGGLQVHSSLLNVVLHD
jgi:CRP/FNR family transcriptional regulator, cyclic AMP receptor protein